MKGMAPPWAIAWGAVPTGIPGIGPGAPANMKKGPWGPKAMTGMGPWGKPWGKPPPKLKLPPIGIPPIPMGPMKEPMEGMRRLGKGCAGAVLLWCTGGSRPPLAAGRTGGRGQGPWIKLLSWPGHPTAR